MSGTDIAGPSPATTGMIARVRSAVLWRSGSQIVAQTVAWASTFLVIRLLDPSDYGLFAMTQVLLVLLNLMNGFGLASALVRAEHVSARDYRQLFGMLVLLNGSLMLAQIAIAPLAASYYRQPLIADIIRVQGLLFLSTPFAALAYAMLNREMDFKSAGQMRLLGAVAGAITAVACAFAGWGVWTLVAAPMALFYVEAIGMTWKARSLMWPSFDFRGAGQTMRYGGTMMLVQFFWFLQSQADVFIAGRLLDPHWLGIYTTALFLTQILASKFIPPLNEVAFAAYSKVQGERDVMHAAFLKAVRLILLIALPAYVGMAVTAEPLVLTFLGEKWREVATVVPILAVAMPFMTLQILFAPATNALGRAGIALRVSIAGGLMLPAAFLVGVHWGVAGLAWAWVIGMVALTIATAALSLPAIGASAAGLARAVAPGLFAALAMGAVVLAARPLVSALPAPAELAALAALGIATYAGLLFAFARPVVRDAIALIRHPG